MIKKTGIPHRPRPLPVTPSRGKQRTGFNKLRLRGAERSASDAAKAKLERDLKKGYQAKAHLNLVIARDFEDLDQETLRPE